MEIIRFGVLIVLLVLSAGCNAIPGMGGGGGDEGSVDGASSGASSSGSSDQEAPAAPPPPPAEVNDTPAISVEVEIANKELAEAIIAEKEERVKLIGQSDSLDTSEVSPDNFMRVYFLDVGFGDAIFISAPDGKTMMVDGGPSEKGEEVVGFLKNIGVERIDVLVSTHPHKENIGGFIDILNNFPVGKVFFSGQKHGSSLFQGYLGLIEKKGLNVSRLKSGDVIDFSEEVDVFVISPPASLFRGSNSDINENSIVLKIAHEGVNILLTGGAGTFAEASWLSQGVDLESQVLKVGNHGSKYSTSQEFLEAVDPIVAIVSTGDFDTYGYPHQDTLDRLSGTGAEVYTTSTNGNIVILSTGKQYQVRLDRGFEKPAPKSPNFDIKFIGVSFVNSTPDLNEEWVALQNSGNTRINLTNWTLSDRQGNTFKFPFNISLDGGGGITIYTGMGGDAVNRLYWGSDMPIWDDENEIAVLKDAEGVLVATYS